MRHPELGQLGLLLWFILFFSLLWPTFFMGVSLPFLAKALTSDVGAAAPTIGGLYGANTFGAAIGAFITSWILIPNLGLAQSLIVGVALNLSCAVTFLLLVVPTRERATFAVAIPDDSQAQESSETTTFTFRTWFLLYFLSGFIALSLEILWLRLLSVSLKASSFTFGTMLAVYLGGLGSGAFLGTRFVRNSRRPAAAFLILETCVTVFAAIAIVVLISSFTASFLPSLFAYLGERDALDLSIVLKGASEWWRNQPLATEEITEIHRFLFFFGIVPLGLIFPATVLMGLSFPYLQKSVQRDLAHIGRRLGALQLANILGAMAGTLLTGLALLNILGTASTFKIIAALGAIFAGLWVWHVFKVRVRSFAVAIVFALLLFLGLPSSQILWSRLHGALPN